jgi:hypothetical protein
MKIFRKGQAATEYLIILAVVIVIALVVVVAMGKFPGIGKSTVGRSSAAFWSTQDIAITDYAISASGADTFVVKNNMRNAVTITSFLIGTAPVNLAGAGATLGPGGTATFSGATSVCGATQTGQSYAGNLSITYTDISTSAVYTVTGDGTKLEGTCAN